MIGMNHSQFDRQTNSQSCATNRSNHGHGRPFSTALAAVIAATLLCSVPPIACGTLTGSPVGWGTYIDFIYAPATNVVPANVANLTAIGGGWGFSLGLTTDHTVIGWGDNTLDETNIPTSATNVVAIAARYEFGMALRSDGTVIAWGDGSSGQTNVPANVTNAVAIAAGYSHAMAILSNGTVVAWGDDSSGQTNVPATVTNAVAVAGGLSHSLALLSDGSVIAWGDGTLGQTNIPSGATNVVAIAAGQNHSLALRADGTVVAWGDDSAGQTNVPASVTNAVAIGAGASDSFAVLTNGSVVAWGLDNYNQTDVPASVTNAIAVTGGYGYGLVLLPTSLPPTISCPHTTRMICTDTNGTPADVTVGVTDVSGNALQVIWYVNGAAYQTNNVLGSGRATSTNVTLAADFSEPGPYTIFVTASDGITSAVSCVTEVNVDTAGTVFGWGNTSFGLTNAPADLTNAVAVSQGFEQALALKSDGTVVGWGPDPFGEIDVPSGATDVVAIAAGRIFSLALKSDGTVLSWGYGFDGETNVPASVTNAVAIAGGGTHALALISNGTVIGWGGNDYGQTNVPASVTNAIAVSAGYNYSLALKSDGTVVGWGDGADGETNVPSSVTNAVAISAGYYHALALESDGTIVAWGSNTYGEATVPTGATNALAIAAGEFFSLALMPDGTVMAWGADFAGQTEINGLADAVAIAAGQAGAEAIDGLQINLIGPSTTNIECHSVWTDPGWTASGLCGVDLTSSVTTNGPVNTFGAGITYPVIYEVVEGAKHRFTRRMVTVVDNTPPVPDVDPLPDIVAQCSIDVTNAPTSTDACAGSISGTTTDTTSFVTQGTFFIHWTYRDGSGNATIQTQRVIVADTVAPVPDVDPLPDIVAQCSTNVTDAPTATDSCVGLVAGTTGDSTTFDSQGTNFIEWTYSDGHGNSVIQTQRVIVAETNAPTITCPTNITVNAANTAGATVTFATPTASNPCSDATVVCVPPSGNVFAAGTNTVTCTASDPHGQETQCAFSVIVLGALDQTVTAFDSLSALRAGVTNSSRFAKVDIKNLDAALSALTNSINNSSWSDNNHPVSSVTLKVFQQDLKALSKLVAELRNKHSTLNAQDVQFVVDELVAACRLTAVVAITDAQNSGVAAKLIAAANASVAKGDAARTPTAAVHAYMAAWQKVRPKKS
jgi:alpha-tubulin suppressor-like RCC1 family protein